VTVSVERVQHNSSKHIRTLDIVSGVRGQHRPTIPYLLSHFDKDQCSLEDRTSVCVCLINRAEVPSSDCRLDWDISSVTQNEWIIGERLTGVDLDLYFYYLHVYL
jgi:hypothetical protein